VYADSISTAHLGNELGGATGGFSHGLVSAYGGGTARLQALQNAGVALGGVFANYYGVATITNAMGYALATNNVNSQALIEGEFPFNLTFGLASSSYGGICEINSYTSFGSITTGYARSAAGAFDATVKGRGHGVLTAGYANATTGTTLIETLARGAFAQGYARNATIRAGYSAYPVFRAGFAQGVALDGGLIEATSDGSFAHGYTNGGTLRALGVGSSVGGYVFQGVGSVGKIEASGFGTIALGAVYGGTGGNAVVESTNPGAASFGNSTAVGAGSTAVIGNAGFSVGVAYSAAGANASVTAAQGGFANGYANTIVGAFPATITTTYAGGFVSGFVSATTATSRLRTNAQGAFAAGSAVNALIEAVGIGAMAQGSANGFNIYASGAGSFARGSATAAAITASGTGSMAMGSASSAITASATNSFQFGPGVNAQADSLKIGTAGLAFKGTTGAPTSPVTGNFWIDSGSINVHSGTALLPRTDVTSDFGSATKRWKKLFGVYGFIGGASGSGALTAAGASIVAGYASGTSGTVIETTYSGAFATGNAVGFGAFTAKIRAVKNGAMVFGSADGTSSNALLESAANGSLTFGLAANGTIRTTAPFGGGSVAGGETATDGVIEATKSGALALGRAANGATIGATGQGAFAQGSVSTSSSNDITASGVGSLARGSATGGYITASGDGAFAQGWASASNIVASGYGSFAFGRATTAITASATNSFQFGPGVNAQADSFQVGNAGVRLLGTTTAPTQNGEFGVNGTGKIVLRTGGFTWTLVQSSAFTPTNVTTDRSFDANATTTDELADVLGTLIADLQAIGILG
jgi:hypothetical protein